MAIQKLRGLKASKPALLAGQMYVATDTHELIVGLGSGVDITIQSTGINNIGVAGQLGFGVGIAPYLPSFMAPMAGTFDKYSDAYGNYRCLTDGSQMVWIPKHYVKITNVAAAPYYGTKVEIASAQDFANETAAAIAGYFLPRAFIDGGVVKDGFFVDKVKWSLTNFVYTSAGIASSILASNPISSAVASARDGSNGYAGSFSNCKSNGQAPTDTYGGAWATAKSRGSDFALMSIFIRSALGMLSLAHGQAATSTSYCAWYDGTGAKNYPKGNNNYGADYDEAGTTFAVCDDAYWAGLNCARKNGSGSPFAKTTHNGQACGVADLNGNQYDIVQGLTHAGTAASGFRVLKESTVLKSVTGGTGGGTDHFANAALFDTVTLPTVLTDTTGWIKMGNGTYPVLGSSVVRTANEYLLAAIGFGKDNNAYSADGINLFGVDGTYRYLIDELCPLVSGPWAEASHAGLWYLNLSDVRTYSNRYVSGRSCLYV